MKRWTALLMCLLAVSAQAQTRPGATWQKITGSDTMTIYADLTSYSSKGNVATIWVLEDLPKPADNASLQSYQSIKKLVDFDCPEKTFTTKYQIVHAGTMGKGSVVSEGAGLKQTAPVVPDTEMDAVFKWVCR